MELDHLALAEKAVAEGERHIEREEQMISDLDRGGHDTVLARAMLETLRRMQAEHAPHRNLLLKMLGERRERSDISARSLPACSRPEQTASRPQPPSLKAIGASRQGLKL